MSSSFIRSVIFCEAVAIYGVIISIILYSKVQALLTTDASDWANNKTYTTSTA
jgi:hypothetical protein